MLGGGTDHDRARVLDDDRDAHRLSAGSHETIRGNDTPRETHLVSDPAAVIRRYFEIVADLGSSRESLVQMLHPDVRVIEHPNAINPRGAVRDREAVVAGFLAGKALLAAQSIDILELLVSENRAVVRATWRGRIGDGRGGSAASTELVAHIAGWLTVESGRIREHETFDCYEPLPPDARTAD